MRKAINNLRPGASAEKELLRHEQHRSPMHSESWRVLRIQSEVVDGFENLRDLGPAVSVYGSARTDPAHPSYKEAEKLGRLLSKEGFAVITGGGPGIMEAANRGAMEAGGKSIGLSIELPHEQFANPYISPELSLNFHYFFMRKLWFAQVAKALIVFPGGFGTFDELFEMLTLLQTGKLPKNSLILIYGRKYWDQVLNFRAITRWGMISPSEFKMLQFANTVDEAFDRIKTGLEKYHMELNSDL